MPQIKIRDRDVHIQELNRGTAQTVVLIHGMFSNLSVYYFKIAPLLAARFHVVMYDLKSHGLSSKVGAGYRFDAMTADLIDLLDALHLKKVHLIGYSFGGLVALNTAYKESERVLSLGIIEGPNPGDGEARDLIDIYSKEFLEHYIQNFTDTTKIKMGKRQLEKNHQMYQFLFHDTSIKKDMELEARFFSTFPFENVKKRVLLLYGKQSNCLPAGELLASSINDSQLATLEGDHNLPIQAPESVGHILLEFLSRQMNETKQESAR